MPEDDRDDAAVQSGRRKRPPLVTRRQAVDAAYELIAAEGPAGLSMRKLAAALHVSLPTVYTAVESRETLIGELQDRLVAEMAASVRLGRLAGAGTERGSAADPSIDRRTDRGTDPSTDLADLGGLGDLGADVLRWALGRAPLAEFLVVEPMTAAVAERMLATATPEQRAAGRAVLAAVTGDAGASVDPVGAVAFVLTQVRATLWLAAQDQLNAVEPTTWLRIGCANVARGLQALSGVEAPQV